MKDYQSKFDKDCWKSNLVCNYCFLSEAKLIKIVGTFKQSKIDKQN